VSIDPRGTARLAAEVARLSPAEREAFFQALDRSLIESAKERPSNTDALEAQLRATGGGSTLSDEDPVVAAPVEAPGAKIGPYRLLELLGKGGMGSVWVAERTDGLERRVALKLPRQWSTSMAEHLEREGAILASLEHPNIARLYDAGVTNDGRPWLALEYVDGETLDQVIRRRPDVSKAIDLFLQIARAVAFAHARLVVHRDLKPRNVMVGRDGKVRLLDFGIAKLLDRSDGHTTALGRAFTPDYASPEQLDGERVNVATDVFSLGVIFYELLAGRRPFAEGSSSGPALARALREARPLPPSAVGAPVSVRGDLDAIALEAIAAEPSERYPTVDALLADLERYRTGLPVVARAGGQLYFFKKFLARHRIVATAAGLVASTILGAAVISAHQARLANREAERATRVKAFIASIFDDAAPRTGAGGVVTAVDLLKAASTRLQGLEAEPEVAVELGALITEAFDKLGEPGDGLPAAQFAVATGTPTLGPLHPLVLHARVLEADAFNGRGQHDEAERRLDGLLADFQRVRRLDPQDEIEVLAAKSFVVAKRDREEEGIAYALQAQALAEERLGPDADESIRLLGFVANTYGRFGKTDQQLEFAKKCFDRANAKWASKRPAPGLTQAERWYAEALAFSGRHGDALPILQRVVAEQRALDVTDTPRVRAALQRLALTFHGVGRLEEALQMSRSVVELEARHNPVDSDDRIAALATLLRALITAHQLEEAEVVWKRLEALAATVSRRSMRPGEVGLRARMLVLLGTEEGDRLAASIAEGVSATPSIRVEALVTRAMWARLTGHLDEARTLADKAASAVRPSMPASTRSAVLCEQTSVSLALQQPVDPASLSRIEVLHAEAGAVEPSLRTQVCSLVRARLLSASDRDAARRVLVPLEQQFAQLSPQSPFRGEVLALLADVTDAKAAVALRAEAKRLLAGSPHAAHQALVAALAR